MGDCRPALIALLYSDGGVLVRTGLRRAKEFEAVVQEEQAVHLQAQTILQMEQVE